VGRAYTFEVRSKKVFAGTAALLAVAIVAGAELNIQLKGVTVDIHARQVPLQQVLDQLSQKTGMKIVYDTEPPQETISVDFKGLGVPAAVTELLRGHGLTYVMAMDRSGQRVATLLLTHGGGGAVRGGAPAPPPPMQPEEPQEYYEEPQEYPEPPPPPEQTPPPPPPSGPVFAPGSVVQPGGGIPGLTNIGGPPASPPAHIEQVPPSMEGEPPPPPET
jgi:hypothetical protein